MLDPQLKRGLLEMCVLAEIGRGESYGYQIIKDLSDCITISESTLYPILRRLEAAGCLTVVSVEHDGRLRKVYRITPTGRERIGEFLNGLDELNGIIHFIRKGEGDDGE